LADHAIETECSSSWSVLRQAADSEASQAEAQYMNTWLETIYGELRGVVGEFSQQVREQGLLPLLRPVAPFNEPAVLAPVIAVSAMIGFFFLSGIAISAFAALVVALLAIYLVLAQVFGYSFEFIPLRVG